MPIVTAVYVVLWFVQLGAYFAGTHAWLGIGYFLSIVLGAFILALPFSEVAYVAISFYGAYAGWGWPAWQAALMAAPMALMLLVFGGVSKLVGEALQGNRIQGRP